MQKTLFLPSPVRLLIIIGNLHFPLVISRSLLLKSHPTEFLPRKVKIYVLLYFCSSIVFLGYVVCLRCSHSQGRDVSIILKDWCSHMNQKDLS